MDYILLGDGNFRKENLKKLSPLIVIVEAEWSGSCQIMTPAIENLLVEAKQHIRIGKLDYDRSKKTVQIYGIKDLPAFLFFREGELVSKESGLIPKEILLKKVKEFADADKS